MEHLPPFYDSMPKELSKTILPEYVIEPPDVLVIEGVHIIPKSPYKLKQLDTIRIVAPYAIPDEPIDGTYVVEQSGLVQLGSTYGAAKVVDLTIEEAQLAIERRLSRTLNQPVVQVQLGTFQAAAVDGAYRVGMDGTIRIGGYGAVPVVGLTVLQARQKIQSMLSARLENPEISVSIGEYASKGYYVILQGGGLGDQVIKQPSTGNETVLDAIANVQGLSQQSSKQIWISRPSRSGQPQILPVDWYALTQRASAETNYQIFPGDRVFIAEDRLVGKDTAISKLTSPLERAFGFTLLGTGTATRLSGKVLQGGGNPNNNGI